MLSFTAKQLLTARSCFSKFNRSQASDWILGQMRTFYNPLSSSFFCLVLGKRVCVNAFQSFHGITPSKWYSVRRSYLAGQTVFVHGNYAKDVPCPKTDLCRHWIDDLIYCLGDPSPTDDNIFLPMNVRSIDMFSTMTSYLMDDLKVLPDDLPGEDLFRKVHFFFFFVCFLLSVIFLFIPTGLEEPLFTCEAA